jgi:hypothetical protein
MLSRALRDGQERLCATCMSAPCALVLAARRAPTPKQPAGAPEAGITPRAETRYIDEAPVNIHGIAHESTVSHFVAVSAALASEGACVRSAGIRFPIHFNANEGAAK